MATAKRTPAKRSRVVPLVSLVLVLVSCGDDHPLDLEHEICADVFIGPGSPLDSLIAVVPADSLYVTPGGIIGRIIPCSEVVR